MKLVSLILAVLAVAAVANADIVLPVAGGTVAGSQWCPVDYGFDNQPTWNGAQPVTVTVSGGDNQIWGDANGRWGYVDFGANWASTRITQVWTRYRSWSVGDVRVWEGAAWSNVDPNAWPTILPLVTTETRVLPDNQISLTYTGGDTPWVRDADLTAAPVQPAGRYLYLHALAAPNVRSQEYAFIGTIPEPATMSLLALGGLAALRRKMR